MVCLCGVSLGLGRQYFQPCCFSFLQLFGRCHDEHAQTGNEGEGPASLRLPGVPPRQRNPVKSRFHRVTSNSRKAIVTSPRSVSQLWCWVECRLVWRSLMGPAWVSCGQRPRLSCWGSPSPSSSPGCVCVVSHSEPSSPLCCLH